MGSTDITANTYSKRVKTSPETFLPSDCYPYKIPQTDVTDSLIRIIPANTTTINVGSATTPFLRTTFPNLASIRMNQIIVECGLTLGYVSTNTADTYTTNCQPSFVPNISSIITRYTFSVGSSVFCDCYGREICWNTQCNLADNPIMRYDRLYQYPAGSPLSPTGTSTNGVGTSTTVTVRFPLQFNSYDFGNLKAGILPLGILQQLNVDLYFTPAANCMFYTYASAPAGTITLNYAVSNLQFWVEETYSDLIRSSIASQGLNYSYQEWYYLPATIVANTQSISIMLPSRFRFVHMVVLGIRKATDAIAINAGPTAAPTAQVVNKLRYQTADLTEVTKANVRVSSQLRYVEPLVGSLQIVHELKKLFPSACTADYFQNITANGTYQSLYAYRVGTSYAADRESGVDCSVLAAPATIEMTWTSALQNTAYVGDLWVLHTRYVSISSSGRIDIAE
jgi:hypothetical protein